MSIILRANWLCTVNFGGLRVCIFPHVAFDVTRNRKTYHPRDKNFAHDAWRFIGNHLKTERCPWSQQDAVLRCEEVCNLKPIIHRHFHSMAVTLLMLKERCDTSRSIPHTLWKINPVRRSANTRKVAWWVSKVVEVWRGRHLWSQLTTSPTRTVLPAAYHGSGEGPGRYRETFYDAFVSSTWSFRSFCAKWRDVVLKWRSKSLWCNLLAS